jgi:hypothetical protein
MKLIIAAIALLIGLVVLQITLVVVNTGHQHMFNTWTRDCLRAHGLIAQTNVSNISTRYECFVEGKMVTLPGWEGY